MPEAIVLRVDQHVVRRGFPFDKVYFFRKEEESLLPSIFRNALLLPVTKNFSKQIASAVPEVYRKIRKEFPIKRNDTMSQSDGLDIVLRAPEKFVAIIPILYLSHKKYTSIPAYLAAHTTHVGHRKNNDTVVKNLSHVTQLRRVKKAMSAHAALIRNGEVIKPICAACVNSMEMLHGNCHFGMEHCHYNLSHSVPTEYTRNQERYAEIVSR